MNFEQNRWLGVPSSHHRAVPRPEMKALMQDLGPDFKFPEWKCPQRIWGWHKTSWIDMDGLVLMDGLVISRLTLRLVWSAILIIHIQLSILMIILDAWFCSWWLQGPIAKSELTKPARRYRMNKLDSCSSEAQSSWRLRCGNWRWLETETTIYFLAKVCQDSTFWRHSEDLKVPISGQPFAHLQDGGVQFEGGYAAGPCWRALKLRGFTPALMGGLDYSILPPLAVMIGTKGLEGKGWTPAAMYFDKKQFLVVTFSLVSRLGWTTQSTQTTEAFQYIFTMGNNQFD